MAKNDKALSVVYIERDAIDPDIYRVYTHGEVNRYLAAAVHVDMLSDMMKGSDEAGRMMKKLSPGTGAKFNLTWEWVG